MEALHQLEIAINLLLQSLGAWLTTPMKLSSLLGTVEFYIVVIPFIFWCVDPVIGLKTALLLLLSVGANTPLKILFLQPRPYWIDPRVKGLMGEWSFGLPSAHSQEAAALWGFFATLARKTWLKILFCLVIFLIGFSRLYLGVHFLSDVLLGWALGGLLLLLFLRFEVPVLTWLRGLSYPALELIAFLGSLALILLTVIPVQALSGWTLPAEWVANAASSDPNTPLTPFTLDPALTVAGIWLGTVSGFAWVTRKGGGYRPARDTTQKFLRYLMGVVGILVIYLGLKMIFPSGDTLLAYFLRYLRYALVGLWVAAGAPLLFKKFHLEA
jgi:hypothetical protein